MKDPVQVQLPPRYLFFVVLRAHKPRDRISFALFDRVPLNRRHSSVVGLRTSEMNYSKHGLLVQLTMSTG